MKSNKNLHYNNYRGGNFSYHKHQRPEGRKLANKIKRSVWHKENQQELEEAELDLLEMIYLD